jgi:hypothetical protein
LTFFKFGAKVTVSSEKAKEKNGELRAGLIKPGG